MQDPRDFDDAYLGLPIRLLALEITEPSLRTAYDGLLLPRGYQYAVQHGSYIVYQRP